MVDVAGERRERFSPKRNRRMKRRKPMRSSLALSFSSLTTLCGLQLFTTTATSTTTNDIDNQSGSNRNSFQRGCLHSKLPELYPKIRVCNSDDKVNDSDRTCRKTSLNYLEIRIKAQDWESVVFESWILQILLSELLEVPTTIENGVPNSHEINFYHPHGRFELGDSTSSLSVFTNVDVVDGECQRYHSTQNAATPQDDWTICAHIIPEIWQAQTPHIQGLVRDGIVEPPSSLGALGIQGWYVPHFTAQTYPQLTSYLGFQALGETAQATRHFLARTFLQPTFWGDYCNNISFDQCRTPDKVAQRAPQSEYERSRLFVDGLFTGHFRNTTDNDCETFPDTCTGHVGDFPCGWSGATEAYCHHLNIPLQSHGPEPHARGYSYSQLVELWKAANATRNHVVMAWVQPDPTYELFQGTDFGFFKVTLPPPTQTCIRTKVNTDERCSANRTVRVGTPEGVCDEVARPLHKLIWDKLQDITAGPDVPHALHSPAHTVLSQFTMTELEMSELFDYWLRRTQHQDPREAVCQWVVDNLANLEPWIPRTHPRVVRTEFSQTWLIVTTVWACLALVLAVWTLFKVYQQRERRVFRCAQVEFLYLLLGGSLSVALGALLTGLRPTNGVCTAQIWFIQLGYTLCLVPLLIKVAAINRLMHAARRMRRVKLNRRTLHQSVALITLLMVVFLVCWTVLDPPKKTAEFTLTDAVLETGETVVDVHYYCSSNTDAWRYVSVAWNLILILCATAIAVQTWSIKQDFNEAQVLSRLIYSHFLFVVLRAATFFLPDSVASSVLSLVFSLDTVAMVAIYFLPKFLADDNAGGRGTASGRSSALSSTRVSGLNFAAAGSNQFQDSSYSETSDYLARLPSEEFGKHEGQRRETLRTASLQIASSVIAEDEAEDAEADVPEVLLQKVEEASPTHTSPVTVVREDPSPHNTTATEDDVDDDSNNSEHEIVFQPVPTPVENLNVADANAEHRRAGETEKVESSAFSTSDRNMGPVEEPPSASASPDPSCDIAKDSRISNAVLDKASSPLLYEIPKDEPSVDLS